MKQVRAVQECFIGGSLRKIGAVFYVADDQGLRTRDMPPVMELVEKEPERAAPKRGRPRKQTVETEDD